MYNKTMKKSIIFGFIVGLSLVATSTYALATYKWQENTDFTVLQNNFTDGENVKVGKFVNGSTTCFMVSSKSTNNQFTPTNVSISCVK